MATITHRKDTQALPTGQEQNITNIIATAQAQQTEGSQVPRMPSSVLETQVQTVGTPQQQNLITTIIIVQTLPIKHSRAEAAQSWISAKREQKLEIAAAMDIIIGIIAVRQWSRKRCYHFR